jgi:hypothetical protein
MSLKNRKYLSRVKRKRALYLAVEDIARETNFKKELKNK